MRPARDRRPGVGRQHRPRPALLDQGGQAEGGGQRRAGPHQHQQPALRHPLPQRPHRLFRQAAGREDHHLPRGQRRPGHRIRRRGGDGAQPLGPQDRPVIVTERPVGPLHDQDRRIGVPAGRTLGHRGEARAGLPRGQPQRLRPAHAEPVGGVPVQRRRRLHEQQTRIARPSGFTLDPPALPVLEPDHRVLGRRLPEPDADLLAGMDARGARRGKGQRIGGGGQRAGAADQQGACSQDADHTPGM